MSSTGPAVVARHIPAWQRLGLKLKAAQNVEEPCTEIESPKRKHSELSEDILASKKAKKAKIAEPKAPFHELPNTPQLTRKKSVNFTPDTKTEDGDSVKQLFKSWVCEQKEHHPDFKFGATPAFETPEPAKVQETIDTTLDEKERRVKRVEVPKAAKVKKNKPKKAKVGKPVTQTRKPNPAPFLAYLTTYHEDRENWKFNKAHQNHLLKNIFDLQVIPSTYAHQLYAYVRGLLGGVRTRLRDAALAVKVKDLEEGNMEGLPEEEDHATREKQRYDLACRDYVAKTASLNSSDKMGYEEVVLAGLSGLGMKRRMAKRVRAERILAEFANEPATWTGEATEAAEVDNSKTLPVKKAARRRKTRTLLNQDNDLSSDQDSNDSQTTEDSSSESDSGSESDSYSGSGAKAKKTTAHATEIFHPKKKAVSTTTTEDSGDESSSSGSSTSGHSASDSEATSRPAIVKRPRPRPAHTFISVPDTNDSDSDSSSSSSNDSSNGCKATIATSVREAGKTKNSINFASTTTHSTSDATVRQVGKAKTVVSVSDDTSEAPDSMSIDSSSSSSSESNSHSDSDSE
ncbi:hypothetical protein BJ878DRAFT_518437 [Calycina marina]|uniref:WKF domain-containing protein n=1 Tax=Calycina marina TaxID=1763456 RepID=A0A9P7YY91_9HELO|nr:hypothetical protein BJ878DRAFT_518437 [Calycina marina]